ncbi:MAG: hypothetical protein IPF79_14475 [Ignavibacteria bacterium]|nr:hypothetical protein [Ignavibacteria bacterium]
MSRILVALLLLFSSGALLAGVPGWRTVQRLARPLTGHGVTMVHTGDVLVVGGSDATGATVSDVWVVRGATGQRVQALSGLSVPSSTIRSCYGAAWYGVYRLCDRGLYRFVRSLRIVERCRRHSI